jgi:hypothetical protein
LSAVYELPFGPGKRFLSRGGALVRHLAAGWQLQAVWQSNSGAPLGFGNAVLVARVQDMPLPARPAHSGSLVQHRGVQPGSGSAAGVQPADSLDTLLRGARARGGRLGPFGAQELVAHRKMAFAIARLGAERHESLESGCAQYGADQHVVRAYHGNHRIPTLHSFRLEIDLLSKSYARREFLVSLAAALAARAESKKPNLVLILADDLGQRDLVVTATATFQHPILTGWLRKGRASRTLMRPARYVRRRGPASLPAAIRCVMA